ncbi:glutamine amidotransferase [Tuwongella immobilis]|uniref:Putative glutamine amidotransferase domain-containing protein n=1 Tax=Tuwongella immobilis TaxID=692036 RepID=A0A6C2YY80_9BACT|nr:glutamine amidotransferase [Tuwongella immobilis]VIP05789.1 Uncharacterized membrane protein OS=Singulisphaera acidiphila (strain ATCC BAA-1392 / DSM 18658 / VKM B-2454 / MOB10) GN=Sinac_2676 PE=4 SV=1: VWA_2: DUF1355 [Tuwongella immobilis]VTS08934.1 Uncharacterized membrane protein OS=Singulisphaera acidiphila (strain ATCC BAA-1392 / DSM 18658 / VKM B-2454 / MOB10) GN=Sinac_2676 PE=4 SV=1: VWA_2: DUF1355 [Tuwongella immobilis]
MNSDSLWYAITRPAYPFSQGWVGLALLLGVAVVLIGLTIATYVNSPQTTRKRLFTLVLLRVLALLVALLVVLRPSLAIEEDPKLPSLLFLVADHSESMTIRDEFNNQSRWEALKAALEKSQPILDRLRDEQNVQVELYRFASEFDDKTDKLEPTTMPNGSRTDFGTMLARFADRLQNEPMPVRGMVVLSDGADNGIRRSALTEAERFRSLGVAVDTFGVGQQTTRGDTRDIALVAITPEPSPVAIKGKLTIKLRANAPGYEGAKVNVRLSFDDKEVKIEPVTLLKTTNNEFELTVDAPATPGEIKVVAKIDPLAGEITQLNNVIETYVTVTKEGLSVLVIDRLRLEEKFIREALSSDKRIRFYESIRQTDTPPAAGNDLLGLDQRFYDVIILGNVSARRLAAGNPQVLAKIAALVRDQGVGLLMMGGEDSFGGTPGQPGSGDWAGTPIADILPVEFDVAGQVDEPIDMVPTRDGLAHYLMRLDPLLANNELLWQKLNDPANKTRLNGMTRLGRPKVDATVLARVGDPVKGPPILVGRNAVGKGRTLAFGGDSTWMWRRLGIAQRIGQPSTREGVELHRRFWKQVVLWLAHQDEIEGNAYVLPEFRRLPVRGKQTLRMGLRGKSGVELPQSEFRYQVLAPGEEPNQSKERPPERDPDGKPRVPYEPTQPGEYRVFVSAKGKDVDGSEVVGEATARFLVYPDVSEEMLRQAADHDFLGRLAGLTNGNFRLAEELPKYLEELSNRPLPGLKPKPRFIPDWKRDGTPGFLPGVLILFVALLGLEWGLRRVWGMV